MTTGRNTSSRNDKGSLRALGFALAGALPVFAIPAPARAQQESAETVAQTAVQDIIVTARRRAESQQDVPLSISAISGDRLTGLGVRRAEDLSNVAPALTVQQMTSRRDVLIVELRGITAADVLLTQDPGVGVYLNDVVQGRPYGLQSLMFDLADVQILYGPQGTLFGRNTPGGAVLINSRMPEFDRFGGEASATLGNYDRRDYTLALNIPVTASLALRGAFRMSRRDGYTYDVANDRRLDNVDEKAGRISALWQPSAGFENRLIFEAVKSDNNGVSNRITAARACGAIDPAIEELTGRLVPTGTASCVFGGLVDDALATQAALSPRRVSLNVLQRERTRTEAFTNITTLDVSDNLTLKNIFGYRHARVATLFDQDGSTLPILQVDVRARVKQLTEELQVQGHAFDNSLQYVVGGYYFREWGRDDSFTAAFAPPSVSLRDTAASARNTSYSIFAQGTWTPASLSALSITAGGRQTWDKRRIVGLSNDALTGACLIFADDASTIPLSPCRAPHSASFSSPTYNFSIQYRWSPQVQTYIAHRRGYRSGGFNGRATKPVEFIPFEPETIKDVELGLKSDFSLGGMAARANIAIYKAWYDDLQEIVQAMASGAPATVTINAASAAIKGGEAELTLVPAPGLELGGNIGVAKGRFNRFATSLPDGTPVSVSGVRFPNSEVTWSLRGSYTADFGDGIGAVTLEANYARRSDNYNVPFSLPFLEPEQRNPGYGLLNASLKWSDIGGTPISATLFGTNLTNEVYRSGNISIQRLLGITVTAYGPPRMYGLELGVKF